MSQNFITLAALDTFLGAEKDRLVKAGLTLERYAQVIADVNDEIAQNCMGKTVAVVPNAFVHHGCVMARYRLFQDKVTEKMAADLVIATAYFKDVRATNIFVQYAEAPTTPDTADSGVWYTSRPNIFKGFVF